MFIAAVLDTFPQFEARVIAAVDALDGAYPVSCSLVAHSHYESTGRRFEVEPFKPDSVALQEVAAWDAVTEVVGAAALIDALGGVRWTATPLPQDEPVTLTGASIVSYLCPSTTAARNLPLRAPVGTGRGFTSHSSGFANGQMRVLWFDETKRPHNGNLMQGLGWVRERPAHRPAAP
jgi:hypothetical protein